MSRPRPAPGGGRRLGVAPERLGRWLDGVAERHGAFAEVAADDDGTVRLTCADTTAVALAAALGAGYRHIDCAAAYDNQKDVGRGIKEGLEAVGIGREEIWVTSKLWNDQ